jgi:hypothetical protein
MLEEKFFDRAGKQKFLSTSTSICSVFICPVFCPVLERRWYKIIHKIVYINYCFVAKEL